MLAAGSIQHEIKDPGGHLSEENIKFRTTLNFSLVIGISHHGDKLK